MPKIHFALLAHANEACLADQLTNIWRTCPTADVTVFNGGKNKEFFAGQGVRIHPDSLPLRYGNLTPYHFRMMRWLVEQKIDFDFMVVLDNDMMMVREGLEDYLAKSMTGNIAYAGAFFRPAVPSDEDTRGKTTMIEFRRHWKRYWSKYLPGDQLFWAFNPGQTFRRDLVEAMVRWDGFDRLERFTSRARTWAIEEAIFPTLAVGLGFEGMAHAGSEALVFRYHSPAELRDLHVDPETFMVHKVGMSLMSPDRVAIRHLVTGLEVPPELIDLPPQRMHFSVMPKPTVRLKNFARRTRARLIP